MKQHRILSLFLAAVMLLTIFPAMNIPSSATTSTSIVQSKLESFMNSYPPGSRWTASFDGGSGCYGFGKLVVYNLFGAYSGSRYRSWLYDGTSTSGMKTLGSVTSFSASNVQSLLSNAAVGDILQFNTTKQHTMVVYSVESDGVWIYHCDWDNNCGIRLEKFSFGAWSGRNSSKLTLLRSENYPGPDPNPIIRYPTPFKAYCLSDEKIPAYDGINGSAVGYIYGDQDFCEILEVYTNGWVKLNCPWIGYSDGRIVYVMLSVFIPDTSYVLRELTAINKTAAYYTVNGSSSPGYVYVGDVCTLVSEQGNQYCVICPWTTSSYTGNYLVWVDKSAFPCTHSWDSGSVTTLPTCTTNGVKTYTCTSCGAQHTEDLPPLDHDWGSWTKLNDTQHQRVCARNASHKQTEEHTWNAGVVTQVPTATTTGIMTYTCSVCNGKKTVPIPYSAHIPGDINGDGSVNSKDLTRLMKYLAGENVTIVAVALDVNGDGSVNNKDLTRLMKYLAGENVNVF